MKNPDAKDKLIETMSDLLWRQGLVGTSPKAVQEQAQVGQGSMYHHFSSKNDLALAAIQRNADELIAKTEKIFNEPGTAYDKISAFLLRPRNMQMGCKIGNLTRDYKIMEDPELSAPIKHAFVWLKATLEGVFREGIRNGEFSAELHPKEAAGMVLVLLQGGYVISKALRSDDPFYLSVKCTLSLLKKQQ